MNEQSKALRRRLADPAYSFAFFVGDGLDVGCGPDPLPARLFPRCTSVRGWDVGDGDATHLSSLPDSSFDFVHSSHCLEHLASPDTALRNWLRVLKPFGHLIVTIPDEYLYERGNWPSIFNPDHKHSFTLVTEPLQQAIPSSIYLPYLIEDASAEYPLLLKRITLLDQFFNPNLPPNVDQTLGLAECSIEFIVQKGPSPSNDSTPETTGVCTSGSSIDPSSPDNGV